MKYRLLFKWFQVVLVMIIMLSACKSESEKTNSEKQDKENIPGEVTPVEKSKKLFPDIKGAYWGEFDNKQTVLDITKQTDTSFYGKITINYSEIINQEVKGYFSPATKEIHMEDQLRSRYKGEYDGKLSIDYNDISGTFTMDVDHRQFTFNLNKNKEDER